MLSFQKNWYNKFQWIHWCSDKEAVCCFYCVKNYKKTNRDNIPAFIMTGYSNWKNALERFTSHGKSNMHYIAMEAENNNSIKDVLIIHNKNDIRNNNIVLRAIFTSIRYLSQENIAFRGTEHFESKFLKLTIKIKKNEITQLES